MVFYTFFPCFQIQVENLTHGEIIGDVDVHALRLVNVPLAHSAGTNAVSLIDQMGVL